MRFESPWALLTLLAVGLVLWRHFSGRYRSTLRFSSLDPIDQAGKSFRQRLTWLLPFLQVVALACMSVALARPQLGRQRAEDLRQGIAIEMLIDISSSMDISIDFSGERGSRLEVAKDVFEQFVAGDGDRLEGRPNDLIGMVTFARYADTICPMTLGHDALLHFLRSITIEDRAGEDGTAIGDALALGAARLQTAEEVLRRQSNNVDEDYEIASKVVILLTDGENNCGKHLPEEGGALAKKWGIRVYVIGFGDEQQMHTIETPDGPRRILSALGDDAEILVNVAESTGGLFRMAHDAESLRAVYEEIDRMEKSEIRTASYLEYTDCFWPFAMAAAVALFLEGVLRSTWLRKIP